MKEESKNFEMEILARENTLSVELSIHLSKALVEKASKHFNRIVSWCKDANVNVLRDDDYIIIGMDAGTERVCIAKVQAICDNLDKTGKNLMEYINSIEEDAPASVKEDCCVTDEEIDFVKSLLDDNLPGIDFFSVTKDEEYSGHVCRGQISGHVLNTMLKSFLAMYDHE
jgi:hypothetical protein